MAQYRAKGPDGRMYKFNGPDGLSDKDASFFLGQYFNLGGMEEPAVAAPVPAPAPKGESGFIPSIMRAGYQTSALLGDVLPAMVGKAVGAEDYARQQMGEAAATFKKARELFPAEVESYKDIKGVGDALTYIKEAIGEAIPSLIPSLITGGIAGVAARPAVAAATTAATEFAAAEVARAAAKNILTKETLDEIRDQALAQGMKAAQRTALKYQATGAVAGSAAQNVPEVFQNVFEETGKMEIAPALVAGGFNAVLDAVLPLSLLSKVNTAGIPRREIIGAWYKRAGKGAVTGFGIEGGTEAIQEMSSAAAEKFVDQNKNFFTEKNFERFINAGLKGGFGGAAITATANVLTGRAPEKETTEEETQTQAPAESPELIALRQTLAEKEAELAAEVGRGAKGTQIRSLERKVSRLKKKIADEEAKAATEGAPSVTEPIPGAGGAGFEILSPADAGVSTAAPQGPQPAGVAPAPATAGEPTGGATTQPTAVGLTFRTPTDEETNNFYSNAVMDLPGGQIHVSDQTKQIFIAPQGGAGVYAVRQGDPNGIQDPSQFPDFVPQALRAPLIEYQKAQLSGDPARLAQAAETLKSALQATPPAAPAPAPAPPTPTAPPTPAPPTPTAPPTPAPSLPVAGRTAQQIQADAEKAQKATGAALRNQPIQEVPIMYDGGKYTVPISLFGGIDPDKVIPAHGQTLRQLIQRGGVSPKEAANIIKNAGSVEGFEQFRGKTDAQIFSEFPELFGAPAPASPSLEEQMRAMTDAELNEIIDTPWGFDDEYQAAKAEQARRKGVPVQKSLGDLAPELQESIMEKRDELYELTVENTDQKQIARKLRALNQLEERLGIELTKPATLGAKPPLSEIEQEEAESEAAIREAQERRDKTKPLGYAPLKVPEDVPPNIPANAEENYEAVAEESRAQADEANATRKRLVEEHEAAKQAHNAALAAQRALEEQMQEAEKANDTAALDRLALQENEVNRREQDALDRLTDAAQALEAHGGERFKLPPWYKLDVDDKDVYFQNIRNNTPAEHRAAAKALIEYREKLSKDTRGREVSTAEKRIIRNYEENRAFYTKLFNVQFPTWDRLSDAAKKIFTDEVTRERTTRGGKKETGAVLTGIQQDIAFAKVGVQILAENKGRDTAQALRAIEDQMKRRAALLKETEENRKELDRIKRTFDKYKGRVGKGLALPQWLVDRIKSNEDSAQSILNYLRSADWLPTKDFEGRKIEQSAHRRIYKALAQSLYAMKLKTKIKVVPDGSLVEGRIAEYDPSTDTVYITESNIDAPTLLHEFIHAGTVKVLNLYVTGQTKLLTEEQIRAAEQLEDIMYEVAPTMAKRFPDAFEVVGTNEDGTPQYSVMEFVAYGLTDEGMQEALHDFQSKRAIVTTNLPDNKSAWTKFKLLIAEIIGVSKTYFRKSGKTMPTAQNYFLEVAAAFEDILATPTEPIFISPLASTGTAGLTDEQILANAREQVEIKDHGLKSLRKLLFSRRGYEWFVKQFQNERRVIKQISERAERFKMLQRVGAGINDVYGQLTRSTGRAVAIYDIHVRGLSEDTDRAIEAYAKKKGVPVKQALSDLHLIFEARHEPERRQVKYLLRVPLDKDTPFAKLDNKAYTAYGLREEILRRLAENDLQGRTPQDYRAMLKQVVDNPRSHAKVILDSKGKALTLTPAQYAEYFDPKNAKYNVIAGRSSDEIATLSRLLDLPEDQAEINAIEESLKKLTEKTKELDRVSNYWSQPVNNVAEFYDFKNYVPFKGYKGHETIDEEFDLGSRRIGGELQQAQNALGGRLTESENPLLQIKADAAAAAMRAGRRELTLAIKNAVEQGILKGKVIGTINFKDRYLSTDLKAEYGGENNIFHYNNDGTVDVIKLEDKNQREAIRRTYRESSPILDVVNQITSGIGQSHTRYNPAFAPMNFVRDALTNAFVLGAQMGPAAAGRFLTTVAQDTVSGGFKRAFQFSRLYSDGKFDELERLASRDPYVADMLEYVITEGGRVSYLQGIAAKGALDSLMKEVGRSGVMRTKDQIDKFFDIYNDIFELSARTSAFRTMKQQFLAKGESPQEAAAHAAEYAKNFANFEQVGRWGKGAGALFMFFRPAATGAVRAIDALRPALGFNEEKFREEATNEGRTKEQIDNAVATMKEERRNARVMSASLVGFGVAMYMMAAMMSGDDEEGRNKVATDDMARWTRYARFPIPGTDIIFQMPWGFGPGAFAAAGAQIAAIMGGNVSIKDALSNITVIGLDSFLPLPFSRISPIDNFPAFMIDSVTPSMARPFLEYVMNLDGLGREIYNNRQSRYGDAYTGGDNIPEMYKAAARKLFELTDGAVDWSPNTMYFFASNFFDGGAKIASTGTNLALTMAGEKDFDPKNDTLFLSSFIGTKSNVDAREFSKAEDYIKGLDKRIKSLESNPDALARFVENNPEQYMLVKFYNQEVNGALKKIRAAANQVRADPDMSIKERKAQLQELIQMQNTVKRRLLEGFETLGYER